MIGLEVEWRGRPPANYESMWFTTIDTIVSHATGKYNLYLETFSKKILLLPRVLPGIHHKILPVPWKFYLHKILSLPGTTWNYLKNIDPFTQQLHPLSIMLLINFTYTFKLVPGKYYLEFSSQILPTNYE